MSNTYCKILIHVVFAVKYRNSFLPATHRSEIYRIIGGLINSYNDRCKAIAIGGTADHVHIFLHMSPSVVLSDLIKQIKVSTNRFINERHIIPFQFQWQKGYAAISVSPAHFENVKNYVNNQMEHHHNCSLRDEIKIMLDRAGIDYDEDFIFEEYE